MNALFTRIFGVFRAFLFFSNCKARDKYNKIKNFDKYKKLALALLDNGSV